MSAVEARAAVIAYFALVYDDIHAGFLTEWAEWFVGSDVTQKRQYDDGAKGARLIHDALHGETLADEYLVEFASEFIERGEVLPPNLARFIVDTKLRKVRRKRPASNTARDEYIIRAIQIAVENGVRATRGTAQKRRVESGTSIVAAELSRMGIHISEVGVKQIWDRHQRATKVVPSSVA
jgi:hypothetical protein